VSKILIYYYSQTGNTEKMAKAVEEGIKSVENTEVQLSYYVAPEELVNFDGIVIGVPTYRHEMASDIRNLFEKAAKDNINLKNKIGAAFGSYGWSGEAPGMVIKIMKKQFLINVIEPPLRIKGAPDQKGLEECRELGKKIAEKCAS
jgi:flavodoxin I